MAVDGRLTAFWVVFDKSAHRNLHGRPLLFEWTGALGKPAQGRSPTFLLIEAAAVAAYPWCPDIGGTPVDL
jgi:hypothetical protein